MAIQYAPHFSDSGTSYQKRSDPVDAYSGKGSPVRAWCAQYDQAVEGNITIGNSYVFAGPFKADTLFVGGFISWHSGLTGSTDVDFGIARGPINNPTIVDQDWLADGVDISTGTGYYHMSTGWNLLDSDSAAGDTQYAPVGPWGANNRLRDCQTVDNLVTGYTPLGNELYYVIITPNGANITGSSGNRKISMTLLYTEGR